jgi:hypothetical protein
MAIRTVRLALLLAIGTGLALSVAGCATMPEQQLVTVPKPATSKPTRTARRHAPQPVRQVAVPIPAPTSPAYSSFGLAVGIGY